MDPVLESLFAVCEELGASDIHLSTGFAPRFRIRGRLIDKGSYRPFGVKDVDAVAMELGLASLPVGCPDGTEAVRKTLLRDGAIDGALTSPSGARTASTYTASRNAMPSRSGASTGCSRRSLSLGSQAAWRSSATR